MSPLSYNNKISFILILPTNTVFPFYKVLIPVLCVEPHRFQESISICPYQLTAGYQ